ncbi:MAG TPA: tetratricopeptide repeat protein, partial [bacterium]|nr:tetratricopeptide repeat protein [bacterium]
LELGRFDEALALVQRVLIKDPFNPDALEVLADIHIRQHNFDKAIQTLELLSRRYPSNIDAHYRLITIYEVQGKAKEAAVHYARLLDVIGANTLLSLKLGEIYMRSRAYDKAVDVYHRARSSDPNNTEILSALAMAYRFNKEIPKAIEIYESLAELQEDNLQVHASVGLLSIQSGNYEKAVRAFRHADRLQPNNFDFLRSLGFALVQLKRSVEALDVLERASMLNGRDLLTMNLLAPIYQNQKRFTQSDSVFERILVFEPNNEVILNNYSYSLAERRIRLDKARQMIEKALKKAPDNGHYLDTMGWVLFQLEEYAQALIYTQRAVAVHPNSEEVWTHLGEIHHKLGNTQDALSAFQKALTINPDNSMLTEKINALSH